MSCNHSWNCNPRCFHTLFINFYGQTSSLDFLLCYDLSLMSDLLFLFSMVRGDTIETPFQLSKTFVIYFFPFFVFGGCVIFFYVAIDPSWNIYQNNHFRTNTKLHVFFLSSYFPSNIFVSIFSHLSNSLHNFLNINYSQSASNPSSTFMNVNSFLLFM
jgi:hypothetical protein